MEEADHYGVLATPVRSIGRGPRPRCLDLQIATTAPAARAPLLTTDRDDSAGADRLVGVVPISPAS